MRFLLGGSPKLPVEGPAATASDTVRARRAGAAGAAPTRIGGRASNLKLEDLTGQLEISGWAPAREHVYCPKRTSGKCELLDVRQPEWVRTGNELGMLTESGASAPSPSSWQRPQTEPAGPAALPPWHDATENLKGPSLQWRTGMYAWY